MMAGFPLDLVHFTLMVKVFRPAGLKNDNRDAALAAAGLQYLPFIGRSGAGF
jgi:hypothetical protein